MRFKYCPECGSALELRDLGDDAGVPWCERCGKPWFPVFPMATISLVYNDCGDVLLLRQGYISTQFCNLVSGYVAPGESAEECARREIKEETGLDVDRLELQFTQWFAKKDMMMVAFTAHHAGGALCLSQEVDEAMWVRRGEILGLLSDRPGSTSRLLAEHYLLKTK